MLRERGQASQDEQHLPLHVGIIMDGNGRWASARGLPRIAGHKKGSEALGAIVRRAHALGIPFLTVYAFSTENWARPPEEVTGIISLLRGYLRDTRKYMEENVRLRIIGDVSVFDEGLRSQIARAEEDSRNNTGITLNIGLNYGGRDEIIRAVRLIATRFAAGEITAPEQIDIQMLSNSIYTTGQPDVDLIVRTGCEKRLSNFMLWQSWYAELVFSDVLWPDFDPGEFDRALMEFSRRKRRMGGL